MSWFSWFRKKKQPKGLRLTFEYTPGQPIQCQTEWPTGLDDDTNDAIATDFSQLLTLLGSGRLLSVAQEAVAHSGERLHAKEIARTILFRANELLAQRGFAQSRKSTLVVPAIETFAVRTRRNKE